MKKGLLSIVGSGIKFLSHLTTEGKAYIEQADFVLYLVNDPAMQEWIRQHNPNSESLDTLYYSQELRQASYEAISEYILKKLKTHPKVCAVFYGHPTMLVQSSLLAANMAVAAGYEVMILPGISAEACLFSDLRIDPSSCGWLSFEATDFLVHKRKADPASHLILWQIGLLGSISHIQKEGAIQRAILILLSHLSQWYQDTHLVYLYEAAQYPGFSYKANKVPLKDIAQFLTPLTILYIPPTIQLEQDPGICLALLNLNKD